ncbi:recombinase family protein [Streptomyces sp. NPDC058301]|uniref:recombinase family protein n=1 Tax=Streptomyces sp. NPDC058301 TaxID=3346436 RepID=UPI0036EA84AF
MIIAPYGVWPLHLEVPVRRAVLYIRLSRDSDDSTSVEAQRGTGLLALAALGFPEDQVAIVMDVDTSGAAKLEDRDGMSAVLADAPAVLMATKLDRYARSVGEFSRLMRWADEQGVTLATADGTLNTGTPAGRMVANVLASFAEYERDMIATRNTEAHAQRRKQGRWVSGPAPWGFRVVRRDGGAYLSLDDAAAELIREIARRVLEGETLSGIARDLTRSGVPTPGWKGIPFVMPEWSSVFLKRRLLSPAMRGWHTHRPVVGKGENSAGLRGAAKLITADGATPVQFGPEILDAGIWATVKAELQRRAGDRKQPQRRDTLLLHIATCGQCDAAMYYGTRHKRKDGTKFGTYMCSRRCPGSLVTAERMEERVKEEFLMRFGRVNLVREVVTDGTDHAGAIADAEAAMERLADALVTAEGHAAVVLSRKLAEFQEQHARLQAEHNPGRRVETVRTGRTCAEEWDARSDAGRRSLLLSLGAVATVARSQSRRWSPERVEVRFDGPEWARDPAAAELADIAQQEAM